MSDTKRCPETTVGLGGARAYCRLDKGHDGFHVAEDGPGSVSWPASASTEHPERRRWTAFICSGCGWLIGAPGRFLHDECGCDNTDAVVPGSRKSLQGRPRMPSSSGPHWNVIWFGGGGYVGSAPPPDGRDWQQFVFLSEAEAVADALQAKLQEAGERAKQFEQERIRADIRMLEADDRADAAEARARSAEGRAGGLADLWHEAARERDDLREAIERFLAVPYVPGDPSTVEPALAHLRDRDDALREALARSGSLPDVNPKRRSS